MLGGNTSTVKQKEKCEFDSVQIPEQSEIGQSHDVNVYISLVILVLNSPQEKLTSLLNV